MKKLIILFNIFIPLFLYGQTHFINQTGNMVVEGGYLVLQNSHFTNNATFTATNGTVKIADNSTQSTNIGGSSPTTFKNLEINKTQSEVYLTQYLTIDGQLTLTNGLLDLTSYNLKLIGSAKSVVGVSTEKYIKTSSTGQLKMEVGASEVLFPIGNSSYNPVRLSNAGTIDVYGINIIDEVKENLNSGPNIQSASVNRVWQLSEEIDGGSNLMLNLTWSQTEELPDLNRSVLNLAHYSSNKWIAKNSGMAMGNNPFNFTSSNLQTVGAFGIGNVVCNDNTLALLGVDPPVANAGMDMTAICGEATLLYANTPTTGVGSWSIAAGNNLAEIDDLNEPMTMFSGGIGGQYTLEWTITIPNSICPASSDQVDISFDEDSDADLIQDCADKCMGYNDLNNQDNDLIPDDCDCMPNTINDFLTEDGDPFILGYIIPGFYAANQQLTSAGKIFGAGASTVEFKAGESILLKPGFHAEKGSELLAHIGLCEPDATLVTDSDLRSLTSANLTASVDNLDLKIFPNPLSSNSKIQLDMAQADAVSIGVYNQKGQLIRRLLVNQYLDRGTYFVPLDGNTLNNGFYYIGLFSAKGTVVRKVVNQQKITN